jgi:hypothetical protein
MTINDLKTGMIVQVQLEDDYDGYYVVYKNAISMYPSNRSIPSENYLVGILGEEVWSSAITNKPLSTNLQDTRITKVWIPEFPYYTNQKAINALTKLEPIWTRKQEVTEMTLEQICEALGKNIKIIKG